MDLTPREIHEKQFHDAWRGYNQEEVDDFLDKIAEAVERLRRENDSLRSRISDLDQVVAASRDTESMLKNTLVSAQRAAEEALQNAKARAEQLISAADERVQRANEEARQRVLAAEEEARRKSADAEREHAQKTRELDSSIDQLTTYEAELKQRLRAFLESEIKSLTALTDKEKPSPAPARSEPRPTQQQPDPQPQQSRPPAQRLHAAPATSYREREGARPVPRPQPEARPTRAEPFEDAADPVVRRRRPAEEQPRRGLRGFFWGGDQG
jgi:cell division initiation protein